jgi:hypothetical protein
MKTLCKISITLLSAIVLFAACEKEIEKNSGITDYVQDPSKAPSGVVTGDLLDTMVTSITVSFSVSNDGGSPLLENGVIVGLSPDFTLATKGVIIQAADTARVGDFTVTVTGLTKDTPYYYKAYSYNVDGITYGDVKSCKTKNLPFSYTSDFKPETAAVDGWVFDKYTGYGTPDVDLVWLNSAIGTTSVSSYWEGEDLTLISPLITVNNSADTLGFHFFAGGYGSPQTQVKVYITEDLSNYGAPVKDWSMDGFVEAAHTAIPMEDYFEKSIYVVIVIEAGDFFLYRFSVAPTTNVKELFP